MAPRPEDFVFAVTDYLRDHPESISRAVFGGLGLRFGLPLAAVRWLLSNLIDDAKGLDPTVEERHNGLFVGASLEKMETKMRVSAIMHFTKISMDAEQVLLELRVDDLKIDILSTKRTMVSALIRSGALDVSQIGELVNELPDIPPFVVEAVGNRLVFDLMRAPSLAHNPLLRHAVGLVSSFITVRSVQTNEDHLDVALRAFPRGRRSALRAVRHHFVRPAIGGAFGALDRWQRRRLAESVS